MGFVNFGKKGDDKTLAGLIDKSLTSITIPDTVTVIGAYTFNNCNRLKSIIIQGGIKSIGGNAFNNCTALATVIIQEGVENIRACAFQGCSGLTSISLPSSVKSVGDYVFQNCRQLTTLILLHNAVVSLVGAKALANTPITKGTGYIYVPKFLLEDYKIATNWVTYADQFRAIEDYPDIINGGNSNA